MYWKSCCTTPSAVLVAELVKCSNFMLNFYMMGKALTGMLSSAMTGLYMVVLVVICGFGYFRYPSFLFLWYSVSYRMPSKSTSWEKPLL